MTEDDKICSLGLLISKGYTVDDLITRQDCVESLNITAPEFIPWLRGQLRT